MPSGLRKPSLVSRRGRGPEWWVGPTGLWAWLHAPPSGARLPQARLPRRGRAVKRSEGAGPRHLLHPWLRTAGMFPAQEEADRTVFVGNLEARVREEILYELFLQVPSAGKAGRRRLRSPGTPPHRSSGLPSLT